MNSNDMEVMMLRFSMLLTEYIREHGDISPLKDADESLPVESAEKSSIDDGDKNIETV